MLEYVYDLIINDGRQRAKCVLHPQLAFALFNRNLLPNFTVIRITKWIVRLYYALYMDTFIIIIPQFRSM